MAASIRSQASSSEAIPVLLHDVQLPPIVNTGDTLLVYSAIDFNAIAVTFPAGWTTLINQLQTNVHYVIAWKKADGTEGGTTITVTLDNAQEGDHLSYAIQDAEDPDVQPPELGGSTNFGDGSASPTPANCVPTGGEKDFFWMGNFAFGRQTTINSWPTNYPVGDENQVSGFVLVAVTYRALTADQENIGPWSLFNSNSFIATTVAVHPSSGPPATAIPAIVSGRQEVL